MKRLPIYIAILALTLLAPLERMDVAQLEPVEVVFLTKEGDTVFLATDTKASGQGTDVAAALADLKQTAAGVVYLDTAEYLLVSEDAAGEINALRGSLKGSVRLCLGQDVQVEEVAEYLEVHGTLPKLRDWKAGDPLPILQGKKIIQKTGK